MLAGIIWLSLAPLPANTLAIPGSDKLAHFFAWAVVSLWFLLLARSYHLYWLAALITISGLLEVAQSFTTYRSGDWLDFAANGSGVLTAWWLLPLVAATRLATWLFSEQQSPRR